MTSKARQLWQIIFYLLMVQQSLAQQQKVWLHSIDISDSATSTFLVKNNNFSVASKQGFNNYPDAYAYLRKLVPDLQEQGFLAASIDSVYKTDSTIDAWIFVGQQYKWANLSLDKIPTALLTNANLKKKDWNNQIISPKRLAMLSEKLLVYCENNGYPFASTKFENIVRQQDGLHADLTLDRSRLIHFDTLIVTSEIDISRDFLQRYLGITQGDLYNESQLRLVSKRLKELPFLQEGQPWRMDFTVAKNELRIDLKERKANQLNGLIGLQPNTVETGKFMLTYDILLGLKNALGYGESIAATLQSLQYKSPRFHADVTVPYIFGTPFGIEGSFDLFKRDSAFIRVSFEGGIKYQLNAADYFKISYQTFSNRIVTADVNFVQLNKRLPDNLDISTRGAGVEFYMDRTDYKLNPHKGWQAKVSASGLLRNVKKNEAIIGINDASGFDYESLYDTVNVNKYQYRLMASLNYHIPLLKSMVFKVAYNGGYISGNNLFLNELYQLGGFKLLRGFDEQSIFANQYHIATFELRVLLGQNSYFYIFNDDAFIATQYRNIKKEDYPVSLGGGITLENKSGIFNIALGLGKRSGESFQFRQARIHFGYTAYF